MKTFIFLEKMEYGGGGGAWGGLISPFFSTSGTAPTAPSCAEGGTVADSEASLEGVSDGEELEPLGTDVFSPVMPRSAPFSSDGGWDVFSAMAKTEQTDTGRGECYRRVSTEASSRSCQDGRWWTWWISSYRAQDLGLVLPPRGTGRRYRAGPAPGTGPAGDDVRPASW